MAVVFHLPGALTPFADGQSRITLAADPDVGQALVRLFARHPGLRDRIQDESGQLRPHVNVFVGSENVRDAQGLATPLAASAEIHILPAVSGG